MGLQACGGGGDGPSPDTGMHLSAAAPTDTTTRLAAGAADHPAGETDGNRGEDNAGDNAGDSAPARARATALALADEAADAAPVTAQSAALAAAPLAIAAADVLGVADPSVPFAQQQWNLLCNEPMNAARLPGDAYLRSTIDGGHATGLSRVQDLEGGLGTVFQIGVADSELDSTEKHRCEISLPGDSLPYRSKVWHAVSFRTVDWQAYDDEQIVLQWKSTQSDSTRNPVLSLSLVRGRLELQVRHNPLRNADASTNQNHVIWQQENFDSNRWHDVVLRGRLDHRSDGRGFVQMWLDGTLVASYQGPIGFNLADQRYRAKVGFYRYRQTLANGGDWPVGQPARWLQFGKVETVSDPTFRYRARDLRHDLGRLRLAA